MECKSVKKDFKVIGLKGRGAFDKFGIEVPELAQKLVSRSNEIQNHCDIEIALFEPKKDSAHLEGDYYVGLIVNDTSDEIPSGMELIKTSQHYVTTKGKLSSISNLHSQLLNWANEQGYTRDLESYIVETYHPIENEEEEVQIYLPINS